MRRSWQGVLLILVLVFTAACGKQEEAQETRKRTISSAIDQSLVEKLTGDWLGTGGGEINNYTIALENEKLKLNQEVLEVTDTKNQMVYTQTMEEKPFFYDFQIEQQKVILLPSYPVPKGTTGGSLAPIELIKYYTNKIAVRNYNREDKASYETELGKILSYYEQGKPFKVEIANDAIQGAPITETIFYDGEIISYRRESTEDPLDSQEVEEAQYKKIDYRESEKTEDGLEPKMTRKYVLTESVTKEAAAEIEFDVSDGTSDK